MLSLQIFCCISLLVIPLVSSQNGGDSLANQFCFQCKGRRNNKDLYPHPADCHKYFQCFYSGVEGQAIGIERDCPTGTFWHSIIHQCVPEFGEPCSDPCMTKVFADTGCYPEPNNCASFFVCSSWSSYPICCPPKTAFNVTDCSCHASETCTDECIRQPVSPPTTLKAVEVFEDYCIDSWDNELRRDDDSRFFILVGEKGKLHRTQCAPGSTFSLEKCSCSEPGNVPVNDGSFRQCYLYLPYNSDYNDHSIHRFVGDKVGDASISTSVAARGTGSIHLQGGHVEYPYMKGIISQTRNDSFCAFFRCENPPCNFGNGGIISTRDHKGSTMFPYLVAMTTENEMRLECWCLQTDGTTKVIAYDIPMPSQGLSSRSNFIHYCQSADTEHTTVYINSEQVAQIPLTEAGCQHPITDCPFTIGHDQDFGPFIGYVDEVLGCRFALTAEDVKAHWEGSEAMRARGLIP